jgi:hypothetical protein
MDYFLVFKKKTIDILSLITTIGHQFARRELASAVADIH